MYQFDASILNSSQSTLRTTSQPEPHPHQVQDHHHYRREGRYWSREPPGFWYDSGRDIAGVRRGFHCQSGELYQSENWLD